MNLSSISYISIVFPSQRSQLRSDLVAIAQFKVHEKSCSAIPLVSLLLTISFLSHNRHSFASSAPRWICENTVDKPHFSTPQLQHPFFVSLWKKHFSLSCFLPMGKVHLFSCAHIIVMGLQSIFLFLHVFFVVSSPCPCLPHGLFIFH